MSDLPATMTAIEVSEPGGPEALKPVEQPLPAVGTGEILIKVAAAGINRADILQRRGFYPPPPGAPNTPGLEAAGTVAALGAGVSGFAIGDEVCCLLAGGGYAEYCAVPAPQVLPVPKGLSMVEAGAVPETFFTVWTNVFDRAGLKSGERFLVHGGSAPRRSSWRTPSAPRPTPPPARPRNARPVKNWAPNAPSTTARRISSPS